MFANSNVVLSIDRTAISVLLLTFLLLPTSLVSFCYPRTSDPLDISAFNDVLECCITMIEARNTINQKMHEEELPSLSYRISADYIW
jgi:hypothetical protein